MSIMHGHKRNVDIESLIDEFISRSTARINTFAGNIK